MCRTQTAVVAGVWMSFWACSSRPADREWLIKSAGLGRVTSITRCNDIVFIADNRLRIHRFDVRASALLPDLPLAQNLFATAMASDCRSDLLYVVTTIPLGR